MAEDADLVTEMTQQRFHIGKASRRSRESSVERASEEDLRELRASIRVRWISMLVWKARHFSGADGLDRKVVSRLFVSALSSAGGRQEARPSLCHETAIRGNGANYQGVHENR